jgi:hypothetical protein
MRESKRALLIACGILFVGLATLGMALPVLPTTPFLLLAAVCFARSSPRFYNWLLTNRWFGAYIRNYREGRGIALIHKVIALTFLWLTIGYAAGWVVAFWPLRVVLVGIALGVTVHLVRAKTYRPEAPIGVHPEAHQSEDAP